MPIILNSSCNSLFYTNLFRLIRINLFCVFVYLCFGSRIEHHGGPTQNNVKKQTFISSSYHQLSLLIPFCRQRRIELVHILFTVFVPQLTKEFNFVEPVRHCFSNLFASYIVWNTEHFDDDLLVVGVIFIQLKLRYNATQSRGSFTLGF